MEVAMLRGVRWALGLGASLAMLTTPASAQYIAPYFPYGGGGYGWASTPQGDIARGLGAFSMGIGQMNLSDAYANSINTDTVMRWNTGLWNAGQIYNQARYLDLRHHRVREQNLYNQIKTRLARKPTPADIQGGDALNVILEQLSDPKVRMVALRMASMPLSSRMASKIPFEYASEAVTICLQQMTVDNNSWPLALRSKDFANERQAYLDAIDKVLKEDLDGDLTPETLRELGLAITGLRAKLETTLPPNDPDTIESERFLKSLAGMAKMLRSPTVEAVVAELQKKPIGTVGDLLAFMEMFNLRFGRPTTAEQRLLYENLYSVLASQRDEIMQKIEDKDPDVMAILPENQPDGKPSTIFHRMDWDHLHHGTKANNNNDNK
jgi:hypothetical protein